MGNNVLWNHGTILEFWSIGQVNLCWHGAGYGKVDINLWVGGNILKVNSCVVLVLRLGQVERELVVDREVVETTFSDGVAEIVVLSIPFLAVVTSYACV